MMKDIFLSHSSNDKPKIRKLRSEIESVRANADYLSAWIDEAEIKTGSIPGHINNGLESSRFIGFCLTPSYFQSNSGWTDAEWHAALHVDPDNRAGRLIPILLENCPYIPVLMRHLRMVDLRGNAYNQGMEELIEILTGRSKNTPVTLRGQIVTPDQRICRQTLVAERATTQALPDIVAEKLHCNLLPVLKMPSFVYRAPLEFNLLRDMNKTSRNGKSKNAIKDIIKNSQIKDGIERPIVPAFRLFENCIVTFSDLESNDSLFTNQINQKRIEREPIEKYIQDSKKRKLLVSLFTMALDRHMYSVGLTRDSEKRGKFYFPPLESNERVINWKPWRKQSSRAVAKPCSQNGQIRFWRHQAAYLTFQFVANRFFIKIEPTWVITKDGIEIERGPAVGRLIVKWTGPERNLSLLYHIRFWSFILGRGRNPIIIRAGNQFIEISHLPATVSLPVGISHDYKDLIRELDRMADSISKSEDRKVEAAVEVAQALIEEFQDIDPLERENEDSNES